MSVFIFILDLILIGFIIRKLYYQYHFLGRQVFFSAVAFKFITTLALGCLYLYYYEGGDIINYFENGSALTQLLFTAPSDYWDILWGKMVYTGFQGQPGIVFMSKLVSIVNIFTYSNFWCTSIFLSLLAFSGVLFLAKTVIYIFPGNRLAICLSLFFWPSLVFWSSGLLKEAVAIGALSYILGTFLKWYFQNQRPGLLPIIRGLCMLWLLWQVKYYYCGVLLLMILVIICFQLVSQMIGNRSLWSSVFIFSLLLIILTLGITRLHPNFYLERLAAVIVDNYYLYHQISEVEDVIHYGKLNPDFSSLAVHVPQALFAGLFRPLLAESTYWLKILAGFENLILFILVGAAFFRKKWSNAKINTVLMASIFYCFILAVFLALSAPNFGTLVRYKVGFLPVLLLLVCIQNPLIEKVNKLIK
ncbi:hypothetical protein [Fulvivirga sediminis]|uniref:Uncharacterized protein n=1 Tax=Fulvivirga sediminis TaxID=2803949 RepID=A0A937F9D3_9BACT|nr:hypothetical protein [Fulvivirga sediminis]MBL3656689.1 hypothetical protein [Fulvivirga sediminis]